MEYLYGWVEIREKKRRFKVSCERILYRAGFGKGKGMSLIYSLVSSLFLHYLVVYLFWFVPSFI